MVKSSWRLLSRCTPHLCLSITTPVDLMVGKNPLPKDMRKMWHLSCHSFPFPCFLTYSFIDQPKGKGKQLRAACWLPRLLPLQTFLNAITDKIHCLTMPFANFQFISYLSLHVTRKVTINWLPSFLVSSFLTSLLISSYVTSFLVSSYLTSLLVSSYLTSSVDVAH